MDDTLSVQTLIAHFSDVVDRAMMQLRATEEGSLTDHREVGRARLPSTVIGLLFHAAEHTQRHVGQLLVTARILSAQPGTSANTEPA